MKAWGGTEKAEFGMNVMGCGTRASPTKPSFDPKHPLEVQCPLVRLRSEQNRSLGGRASQNGHTLRRQHVRRDLINQLACCSHANSPRLNISGSLAMLDAIRLASTIVICFAAVASSSVERP